MLHSTYLHDILALIKHPTLAINEVTLNTLQIIKDNEKSLLAKVNHNLNIKSEESDFNHEGFDADDGQGLKVNKNPKVSI